jgi:hypothetical protein
MGGKDTSSKATGCHNQYRNETTTAKKRTAADYCVLDE